jgi:hypothetical protein
LLGLFVASRAQDNVTYGGGLVAAAVALLALFWHVKAGIDGTARDMPSPQVVVDGSAALLVMLALLTILCLLGLFLAAQDQQPMLTYSGYGLFFAALAMIFLNVKHYFDELER